MTFSNINLLNKALLIVILVFLKVKIRKAFHCSVVSSDDLLKLNCHLIGSLKLLTILSLFGEFFLSSYEKRVCFLVLCCIIYTSYSNSFLSA